MSVRNLAIASFLASFSAILLELTLVRVFGLVLFASFTHLALAVALLGIAIGGVVQHMVPTLVPADRLEQGLSRVALVQGVASVVAVFVAVILPLTEQSSAPVTEFVLTRLRNVWELVNPLAFVVMLPFLTAPFAAVGVFFAALFEHRRDRIGLLYGADLAGGALGALALFPLLHFVPAPDVAWISAAAAFGAAAVLGDRRPVAAALVALLLAGLSTSGASLLRARFPAGFSDDWVVFERWTPVARLAIHEHPREIRILLDNSSSSQVVTTRTRAALLSGELGRSLVFRMHDPPAKVGVLAASAGPDVAVAQHLGFTDIEAIDVAPYIGDLVEARYAKEEVNPFRDGNTRRVTADARAAVLHGEGGYDVLQMIHANLHGAAGVLAQAWSPGLLGTVEAFETWIEALSEDGTVSFARGSRTVHMARSATQALHNRGVAEPYKHIAYVVGPSTVVLVKKRPFTEAEHTRMLGILASNPRYELVVDPLAPELSDDAREALYGGPTMTDDRPYTDSPAQIVENWTAAGQSLASGASEVRTEAIVYHLMLLESAFVGLAGLLLFFVPWTVDRRRGEAIAGTAVVLGYAACLGYGYLAVEIALIQRFILLVGHPVIAMTAIVFAMLTASGLGSVLVGRVPEDRVLQVLRGALVAVLVLVGLTAFGLAEWAVDAARGVPMELRIAITALAVAIPAFPMGMALPAGLRLLRPEADRLVPWAWAFNGLFSVVAALGTAVIGRLGGFSVALAVALIAYAGALMLSGWLVTAGDQR